MDLLLKYNINKDDPNGSLYDQDAMYVAEGDAAFWANGCWAWQDMKNAGADPDGKYGFIPFVLGNDTSDFANTSMDPEELLWWERNHIQFSTMIRLTDAEPLAELVRLMSLEFYSADSLRDSTLNLYMQILSNKISDLSGTGENGILRPLYDQLVQLRADIYNRPAVQRKIEEEAERLLISTSYLQHMYKKIFGVTLINDVIHSRIDYSCKLLTGTDFTIQKIAESCGYEYDVYFMSAKRCGTDLAITKRLHMQSGRNTMRARW